MKFGAEIWASWLLRMWDKVDLGCKNEEQGATLDMGEGCLGLGKAQILQE